MNNDTITTNIRSAMKSGKFFNVTFIKKNGTARNMTARMGVKKHHVNTPSIPSTVSHIPKYLTVFDVSIQDYRNVNVDAIIDFKCGAVVAEGMDYVPEPVIKQGTPAECDVDVNNINFMELL